MEDFNEKFENLLRDKLGVKKEDLKPEANFKDDFGADSLDMVELTLEFENVFGITISDDDTDEIRTVGEAMEYIRFRLK